MIRNALAMLGAGLAGLLGLRALGARHSIAQSLAAALVTLALLSVLAALYWQHAVVALAVAALCTLGVAVMFQRIKPGQAFRGAATALVLMFLFTWLAVQLGHFFFGGGDSALPSLADFHEVRNWPWLWNGSWKEFVVPANQSPITVLLMCLGVAFLVTSFFLRNVARAVFAFLGLALLSLALCAFLNNPGVISGLQDLSEDPLYVLLGFLAVLAVIFRLVENANLRREKNPRNR